MNKCLAFPLLQVEIWYKGWVDSMIVTWKKKKDETQSEDNLWISDSTSSMRFGLRMKSYF